MDIHIASTGSSNTLPRGFSVFQPALGAQLQWFPVMGSKELDDMLHAYLPGAAPIADKRAAVSVDFLEHLHMTGQTFKFYQIEATPAFSSTSASSSPASASGASSMSGFPATPTWDFNSIAYTPSSTSSQTSTSALKARKSAKAASVSRHQTTDFSHLPGMKIMTKDGVDVTNAASRGSKTKEQRDHAHLMRIIKACDSCRAKKVRCDPSHKKRAAPTTSSSATPAPPPSSSRQRRQTTVSKAAQPTVLQAQPDPVTALAPVQEFNWDEFDASMAVAGVDYLGDYTNIHDPWSQFMYDNDTAGMEFQNFLDIGAAGSPMSSFTTTTSSGVSTKPHSPLHASAHGDLPISGHPVTNSSSLTSDDQDTWSHELGLVSTAESNLYTHHKHGLDAPLLSSTGTGRLRHRLEDPGTFSNPASSSEPIDTVSVSSGLATSLPLETVIVSGPSDALGLQAPLLVHSTVSIPAHPTNATVHDPARTLLLTSPGSGGEDVGMVTTPDQSQSLAGTTARGGILGLLPIPGPIVPDLAQSLLAGISELIAASAPLSSTSLATLLTVVAFMAASFVASVGKMFSHGLLNQSSLLLQYIRPQSPVVASQHDRFSPRAFCTLPLAATLVGVC
ncbi:hypothetical protein NLU13_0104 [Sarocladium strictum]|uniref:Zn(2)-C6 fungal-type domain-containing protein n=1 Tax=Sarocladium strictum TaxID=5046 RepID=A0AA39GNG0_SARSR|nr:hypothetical protein NLU13_0104 [Sarocladium strictum]